MQMEFTGERYVPELLSAKISYEHWHRYIFASRFCIEKNVLDIACGEGYGTAFIGQHARKVTGVDISDETVIHAKSKYHCANTFFVTANASNMPFEKGEFDVVISFETLEHLVKKDQESFLVDITRVLKEDGLLIISTPNKKKYSDDAGYSNPYHFEEFYKADFELFLQNHFNQVIIFNQQIVAGSIITRPGQNVYSVDHIHMDTQGFLPGASGQTIEMEYFVAVCSNNELLSISGSILLDDSNILITELTKSSQ
jgi:ubiquinone/menaquinone biosynthesis C-methylase UbiE